MRQYFVAAASFPQHVKHSILFFFSFILTIVYVFLSTFIYPVFLIAFIHPVFFPNHFNSIEERERERQTDRQRVPIYGMNTAFRLMLLGLP